MQKSRKFGAEIKLGTALVKEASAFVPVAGSLINAAWSSYEALREYSEKKKSLRLKAFCDALLNSQDKISIESSSIDVSFEAVLEILLDTLMTDIEEEKTVFYVELTKNIAQRKIQKDHRKLFVFTLKELTLNEINEMRESYIAQKYPLIPDQGPLHGHELPYVGPGNPKIYGRRVMENRGLISEGFLTPYGIKFIETVCPLELLTPESINKLVWQMDCDCICYELSDDQVIMPLLNRLSGELRKICVKVGPTMSVIRTNVFSSGNVLLVAGPNFESMLPFKMFLIKALERQNVVVITFPDTDVSLLDGLNITHRVRYESFDIPRLADVVRQSFLMG